MNWEHSQYNVFIFNFIENNARDVELLRGTFKRLHSEVLLHDQPDYKGFQKAVEYICTKNFTLFNYVVIVVLDNQNPGSGVLRTIDGRIVFINRDLIGQIEYNATLRYEHKKLLVLLQVNENLLDSDELTQLKIENPIQHMTNRLGECFSSASLEHCKVKQLGITIRISAAAVNEQLNDDWWEEDPPVSPFIKAFSHAFSKYAGKKDINEVFYEMCDLLPECQPSKEVVCGAPTLIFGKAINPRLKKLFIRNM